MGKMLDGEMQNSNKCLCVNQFVPQGCHGNLLVYFRMNSQEVYNSLQFSRLHTLLHHLYEWTDHSSML